MTEQELFPLTSMKVDEVVMLRLKDPFDDEKARKVMTQVAERCLKYRYVIRMQKYLAKLYIIRVA